MSTGTVRLSDGKYEFDLKDSWLVAARRHGVDWPAGFELRFTNCFVAALNRIIELEALVEDLTAEAHAMTGVTR